MRRARRLPLLVLSFALAATLITQVAAEREAHADFFSVWGQLHGGYISGTADRFEEGSMPLFGFAAGMSITMLDIFMDVRVNNTDVGEGGTAGMWNQVGLGISFGLPIPAIDIIFGVRAAYVYAQYTEEARDAYRELLEAGEREDEPSQRGVNISGQITLDLPLAGPLYLTMMGDVGYHLFLPDVANSHGVNFAGLGGLKLKIGI